MRSIRISEKAKENIAAVLFFVILLGVLPFSFAFVSEQRREALQTRQEQLQGIGLLGEHEVRRIEQVEGISGFIRGNFFLATGSVSGSFSSQKMLQFFWGRTKDEVFSTTLPYSHFKFIIDNAKRIPTIEFIYDKEWLRRTRDPYTEAQKANLNFFLSDSFVRNRTLSVAIVRISQQDLEKEIYLPSS